MWTTNTRLKRLAVVAMTVAVALATLVVAAGGSNPPPRPASETAVAAVDGITELLAGIPQRANVLGRSTAPVTLRWYGDLECPFCREFALYALPSIIRHWVRGGELRIEYLSMETATRDPKVFRIQQVAALAAGLQDRMWNFIETFYHEQGEEETRYVTERYLRGLASQVPGLSLALWGKERHEPQLATQVDTERQAAIDAHYRGTPTFLIGPTSARMYPLRPQSLRTTRLFNYAVEYLLGR